MSPEDNERIDLCGHAAVPLLLDTARVNDGERLTIALSAHAGQVKQAVGIVTELAAVDAATALHRLCAYARRSGRSMREVVAEVRTCRRPSTPPHPPEQPGLMTIQSPSCLRSLISARLKNRDTHPGETQTCSAISYRVRLPQTGGSQQP